MTIGFRLLLMISLCLWGAMAIFVGTVRQSNEVTTVGVFLAVITIILGNFLFRPRPNS